MSIKLAIYVETYDKNGKQRYTKSYRAIRKRREVCADRWRYCMKLFQTVSSDTDKIMIVVNRKRVWIC
jgi:hypothetical protein